MGAGKRNMTLTADDLTHYQEKEAEEGINYREDYSGLIRLKLSYSKDETSEDLS